MNSLINVKANIDKDKKQGWRYICSLWQIMYIQFDHFRYIIYFIKSKFE